MSEVIVVTCDHSDEGVDVIGVVSTIEQALALVTDHAGECDPVVTIEDLKGEGYYPDEYLSYHIQHFDLLK